MLQIFFNYIKISLIASTIVLLIIMVTPLTKKRYSNRWRYYVWIMVSVMLIIPFNLSIKNAPINIKPQSIQNIVIGRDISENIEPVQPIEKQGDYNDTTQNSSVFNIHHIIWLWLIVAVLYLIKNYISYFRYKKDIFRWCYSCDDETKSVFEQTKKQLNINKDIELLKCDYINSPMLIGLFKTKVLVSKGDFSKEDLKHIFLHELTHYSRWDIGIKMFILFAKAIHWFNPFVHIMSKMANEDIEICCDYDAIKKQDSKNGKDYIKTVFKVMKLNGNRKVILSTNFNGGKNRMKAILEYNKKRKGKLLLIGMIVLLLSSQLLIACNDSKSDIEKQKQESKEYIIKDLGYAISLPKSIADNVKIDRNGETVSIDTKFGGTLVFITRYSKKDYPDRKALDKFIEETSPVYLIYLGETEKDYVCYNFPSDVQYDLNDKAMTKKYKDLIKMFDDKSIAFRALSKEESDSKNIIGYVKKYDKNTNSLAIDEVEWLTEEDSDRIKELGYDIDADLPNGFIIHNADNKVSEYVLDENAKFTILKYIGSGEAVSADKDSFIKRVKEWKEFDSEGMLIKITLKDNKVTNVIEQYVP
ncbi:M56 family metallopeptidase [Clostridiaceae bacterium M8S5]|nr:M56 family metallopeptidase [Clostridiaceae bacterium M8S5]